jgi:adenosylcobinamide-GDP ribazoletransferase
MRDGLRLALSLLTVAPVRPGTVDTRTGRAAMLAAPAVGAVLGAVVGAVLVGARAAGAGPLVVGALAVALLAGLTRGLHLDGLADTADGLLPPVERVRRLAIMADPQVGAFGVVVLVLVLLLRVAAFAALAPDVLLAAGLWGAARAAMGVALATLPYARPEGGLASALAATPLVPSLVGGVVALGLVVWAAGAPEGLAAGLGLVVGGAAVLGLAHRRIGGFTGDVLGAAGVIGETCGLLLAAARW